MTRIRTIAAAVMLAAAAAMAAAVTAVSTAADAKPRPAVQGICVGYGRLPLVDADVQYAATVYTPRSHGRLCAKGDQFVAVGPASAVHGHSGQ